MRLFVDYCLRRIQSAIVASVWRAFLCAVIAVPFLGRVDARAGGELQSCCFANGACQELDEQSCQQQGGAVQGPGSGCVPNLCTTTCHHGDCDCDGVVNNFDIDKFVAALLGNPLLFEATGGTQACWELRDCWADVDHDGEVNNFDIDSFAICLLLSVAECPPPGVACCFPDGSCVFESVASCLSQQGEAMGAFSVCVPNSCPQPDVACCFPDGSCTMQTALSCVFVQGTPLGYLSTCSPSPCPQPDVACCFPAGGCVMATAALCAAFHGSSLGYPLTCTPNPCPQPLGACCYASGACLMQTTGDCLANLGDAHGYLSECAPGLCPQPDVACCFPDGSCAMQTAALCTLNQGLTQPYPTACASSPCPPPLVACCFATGTCLLQTAVDCFTNHGASLGYPSSCDVNPCLQLIVACCLGGDLCEPLSVADCAAQGGSPGLPPSACPARGEACPGLPRDLVFTLAIPSTGRTGQMFIPADYNAAAGDPVVISIPGTDSTGMQEMGPHERGGYPWPDCGSTSWPTLALDRAHYPAFAVFCPNVQFNGATPTVCDQMRDERYILDALDYLAGRGSLSRNWMITGWSSGATLALLVGMRHGDLFSRIVVRYGSISPVQELNHNLQTLRNCYDPVSCQYVECFDTYDWRFDPALRQQRIVVVNNDAEPYAAITEIAIQELYDLELPFWNIDHVVFPSFGAFPYECANPSLPHYPYGGHVEAREQALKYFFEQ